jgi:mRNA-degrading endonuclease YafQ of YafQ-DinJ toxin-antitoxin module
VKVSYSPKFVRQYKKLPWELQELAAKREDIFKKDPFDARLKTHKLSGKQDRYWSFSVNYSYRIIFEFAGKESAHFYQIGDHDIYD